MTPNYNKGSSSSTPVNSNLNGNSFQASQAQRESVFLKINLAGGAGTGKSYSSLLLAYGLCGDWKKIVVIDTESGSANLYSNLGEYQVIPFSQPHSPQRYIGAIDYAMSLNPDVVILDSISHEWEGKGGCLDILSALNDKNDFTKWRRITPLHNQFVEKIMDSPVHIITTTRSKAEYTLEKDSMGRLVPRKIGMKSIQRPGFTYEVTIDFQLNKRHLATTNKDRTGLFSDQVPFIIDETIGERIRAWNGAGIVQPVQQLPTPKPTNGSMPASLLAEKESCLQRLKELRIPYSSYKYITPKIKEHEKNGDWTAFSETLKQLDDEVIIPFTHKHLVPA